MERAGKRSNSGNNGDAALGEDDNDAATFGFLEKTIGAKGRKAVSDWWRRWAETWVEEIALLIGGLSVPEVEEVKWERMRMGL